MPPSVSEPLVLIAGAGPTGLILALTLVKNGISVRIIEKDTAFHVGQRGAGLYPRSLELLHYLGCLSDVIEGSNANKKMCMYKMSEGKEVAKIVDMTPYIEPTPDVPFRNPRLIGQSRNESIIRAHLAKYDTHVELGVELVGFTQDQDRVTAELRTYGPNGLEIEQTVHVKYLVGAEGARSVVRKQLGLTFLGETVESTRLLFTDVFLKGLSADYWHVWGDMTTKSVWIRNTEREGVCSIMIGGEEVDTAALHADRDALFKFVREVSNRKDIEFGDVIWSTEFRPNIRMVDKFGEARVFLVGDAAHVHSPTGGQGLNTGIQDSFNLGWKLALVLKNLAPSSLLDSYSDERLPVVRSMCNRTTTILNKTVAYKTGNVDVSHVNRPTSLHQLGVNYRGSPIVVDEQPGHEEAKAVNAAYKSEDLSVLRAGDRAPNAPGLTLIGGQDETTMLFDLFKPTHHTLLLFTSDTVQVKATVERLKSAPVGTIRTVLVLPMGSEVRDVASVQSAAVNVVVVDRDGHAYKYYPPATAGFSTIAIRPDGVVGAVLSTVSGLKQYLFNVFGV